MQKLVRDYLNELNKQQKKRRKVGIAVMLLAVLVVGGVIGVLTQYGVAMTGDPKCGIEEHTHSEECYIDALVCGQEESEGHTHTEACYQTESALTCGLEESEPADESEGHTHGPECYTETQTLVCGQEEYAGHTHEEGCYEKQLACGKEEHTHTDICYIDTTADVEEASAWDKQYENTEWKEAWGEDLVTAAKVQVGYKESTRNYTIAEDGSHKGYTRYGQFMGDVYADWDTAFVNFCLHYAGLEASQMFPMEIKTSDWHEKFVTADEGKNTVYLTTPEGYEPQAGDIIFMMKENEESEPQMGIVSSYDKEKNEIKVIEGNSGNEVKENDYSLGDTHITEFVKISEMEEAYKNGEAVPAEEENAEVEGTEDTETADTEAGAEPEKRTMTAEGPDYTVTVSFTEEAGIPENAVLDVREIEQGTEEYLTYYYESLEKMNVDELKSARYFDITFLVDGQEIEPLDEVDVEIKYADDIDEKGKGKVIHFSQNETEILDAGVDTDNNSISFTQDSFSVDGDLETASGNTTYLVKRTIASLDDLNGKSFLISQLYDNSKRYMVPISKGKVGNNNKTREGLEGVIFTGKEIISITGENVFWTFEKATGGYYVKSNDKYLNLNNEVLKVSEKPQVLSVEIDNGKISISTTNKNYSIYHYKYSGASGFAGYWRGHQQDGGKLTLYSVAEENELKQFTPVPTITSSAFNIKMVKHADAQFWGGNLPNEDQKQYNIVQGILNSTIAEGAEYPTFTNKAKKTVDSATGTLTGTSLGTVFNDGEITDVEQSLFQMIDGYYYYNSLENSARLVGNDLVVYKELTTSNEDENDTRKVGNFLPYATYFKGTISKYPNINPDNAKDKPTLYLPDDGEPGFHFGMELSTEFYQMQNGYNDGKETIYEFSGDDDMWVYIDGVLVLDLGGCHDRRGGTINFATGEVKTEISKDVYETKYLDDIFKSAGHSITDWKTLENGHKIFPDYSKHTFKMWYLERGKGASNLKIKFNLPVIQPGEIQIEKELSNTDKEKYANVKFGFQVFLQPITGEDNVGNDIFDDNAQLTDYRPLCQELKALNRTVVTAKIKLSDGTERYYNPNGTNDQYYYGEDETGSQDLITLPSAGVTLNPDGSGFSNGCTDKAVFYLKPGETLILQGLKDNRKYYVREVGANSTEYDKVTVDGADVTLEDNEGNINDAGVVIKGEGQEGDPYIRTICRTVSERAYVKFINQCSAANQRTLKITKKMAENQQAFEGDTFSFKLWLEDQNGNLTPYVGKYYIANAEYSTTDGIIPDISVDDTVEIRTVLSGTEFLVKEVFSNVLSQRYEVEQIVVTEYDSMDDEEKAKTVPSTEGEEAEESMGCIQLNKDATVTVTNSLKIERTWQIIKRSENTDSAGEKPVLEGAVFELRKVKESSEFKGDNTAIGDNITAALNVPEVKSSNSESLIETEIFCYGKSGTDGIITWYQDEDCTQPLVAAIGEGEYILKELIAPTGYTVSNEVWSVVINTGNKITVKSNNGEDELQQSGDVIESNGKLTQLTKVYFEDAVIYELPSTGGSGIYWYMFSGILLMAGASLITYKKRCREVLRS